MTVYHESFKVKSVLPPTFHEVTEKVKEIVSKSKVKNGIAVVYSQHTTCSIMIQEDSHDVTQRGTKFLLQDLLNVFEKIIPMCRYENQYLHPGPEHIKHAERVGEPGRWSLNTDAHLRSSIIGRSESIPIIDGKLELGINGLIYFVDFDVLRERERFVHVQIVGE